jgi:hypothetical protein
MPQSTNSKLWPENSASSAISRFIDHAKRRLQPNGERSCERRSGILGSDESQDVVRIYPPPFRSAQSHEPVISDNSNGSGALSKVVGSLLLRVGNKIPDRRSDRAKMQLPISEFRAKESAASGYQSERMKSPCSNSTALLT